MAEEKNKTAEFNIEYWPADEIIPYARNPRKITDAAIEKMRAYIREFKVRRPIMVDGQGSIVYGHRLFAAMKAEGYTQFPVHIAHDLTKAQIQAYRLLDNRAVDDVEADEDLLELELDDLGTKGFDLELIGFDDLGSDNKGEGGHGGEPDPNPPEAPTVPSSRTGDLWLLGAHRVLCGDAAVTEDVARLMGDQKAEMVWTDPPYGVSIGDKNKYLNSVRNSEGIEENLVNDTLDADALRQLLDAAFGLAARQCEPGGAWFVAAPAGPLQLVFGAALNVLGIWRQTIQWIKSHATLAPLGVDYHWKAEPIFYGWVPGAGHRYRGGRDQTTVWEFDKPQRNDLHPTMKPIGLIVRAIENHSDPGLVVLDPFLGSGSTLLAAAQTGRVCCGMEIDPRYVDVIVRRWEEYTGEEAVLDGDGRTFKEIAEARHTSAEAAG